MAFLNSTLQGEYIGSNSFLVENVFVGICYATFCYCVYGEGSANSANSSLVIISNHLVKKVGTPMFSPKMVVLNRSQRALSEEFNSFFTNPSETWENCDFVSSLTNLSLSRTPNFIPKFGMKPRTLLKPLSLFVGNSKSCQKFHPEFRDGIFTRAQKHCS